MNSKTFIIAELSANHNNDFDIAVKTIESMAASGADAVKVQTYRPESLTIDLDNGFFAPKTQGPWKGYTPWELYKEASMPYEWQLKLKKIANDLGLTFFSSPFDIEGVDFLESINCPIYKIASFEINHIPLIKYTASKKKPIIISTGVANEFDIKTAVDACKSVGNYDITLLKCTSEYPAKIDDANLSKMVDMKRKFSVKVGVSDHTEGFIVPTSATALGASVIEKHFILDKKIGGPDAFFSMEPNEFKKMVELVRLTERTIGKIDYNLSKKNRLRRRSIFTTKHIKKNELLTNKNIKIVRPGHGLDPKFFNDILGKKLKVCLNAGEPLLKKHLK